MKSERLSPDEKRSPDKRQKKGEAVCGLDGPQLSEWSSSRELRPCRVSARVHDPARRSGNVTGGKRRRIEEEEEKNREGGILGKRRRSGEGIETTREREKAIEKLERRHTERRMEAADLNAHNDEESGRISV